MAKPILSKSTFLRGLQCERSLWLYKHRYDLKDDISPQQEAIFSQGTKTRINSVDPAKLRQPSAGKPTSGG